MTRADRITHLLPVCLKAHPGNAEKAFATAEKLADMIEDRYGEKPAKRASANFKPPGDGEWTEFFVECGGTRGEAAKAWDFYASKGWKIGRNTMKDWKAAVRNWVRRNKEKEDEGKAQSLLTYAEMDAHARKNGLTAGKKGHYEVVRSETGKDGKPLWRAL